MHKKSFPVLLAVLLLWLLLLLPIASWVMAAMGAEVQSVLCGEGLRWLGLHALEYLIPPALGHAVALAFIVGCVQESGILRLWHAPRLSMDERLGVAVAALVFLLLSVGLVWPVFDVDSALRSVTGGLFPSPWLTSLPVALPLVTFLSIRCFCLFAGRQQATQTVGTLLSAGISRYALWLVDVALASLLVEVTKYIFNVSMINN